MNFTDTILPILFTICIFGMFIGIVTSEARFAKRRMQHLAWRMLFWLYLIVCPLAFFVGALATTEAVKAGMVAIIGFYWVVVYILYVVFRPVVMLLSSGSTKQGEPYPLDDGHSRIGNIIQHVVCALFGAWIALGVGVVSYDEYTIYNNINKLDCVFLFSVLVGILSGVLVYCISWLTVQAFRKFLMVGLPLGWRFTLNRIRELSIAIQGK